MYSSGICIFMVALSSLLNTDIKVQNYVKTEHGDDKLHKWFCKG